MKSPTGCVCKRDLGASSETSWPTEMDNMIFEVSQLNERIKELFELDPYSAGFMSAERYPIINYNFRHAYFTLKDAESALVVLRCSGRVLQAAV
jgi:exonuclease VII large subunit